MGFLNHSTNNIIIDAVLTERGRELLSDNRNSFQISYFCFGDDEVDYTNITKYGRIIGKEKIEKNTPIFEANTNENIALKHKLISLPNNLSVLHMPKFEVKINSLVTNTINLTYDPSDSSAGQKDLEINTILPDTSTTGVRIPQDLRDGKFIIKVNNDLLSLARATTALSEIDIDMNKIKSYSLQTRNRTDVSDLNAGLKGATVQLGLNTSFSQDLFNYYAEANSNGTEINTTIQIIGQLSNASIVLPVKISLLSS